MMTRLAIARKLADSFSYRVPGRQFTHHPPVPPARLAVRVLRPSALNKKRKVRWLFPRLKWIRADGGYAGQLINWVRHLGRCTLQIVKRGRDALGFVVLSKRRIVKRTFAGLGKYRRLSKDCQTLADSSESMIYIAMINLIPHRLEPG